MTPCFPSDDIGDELFGDPMAACHLRIRPLLESVVYFYRSYLSVRVNSRRVRHSSRTRVGMKPRTMAVAAWVKAHYFRPAMVFFRSNVFQVGDGCIGLVGVLVIDMKISRSWAEKGTGYQAVHGVSVLNSIQRERHNWIARWCEAGLHDAPSNTNATISRMVSANAAQRRHAVKPFITDNWPPFFRSESLPHAQSVTSTFAPNNSTEGLKCCL